MKRFIVFALCLASLHISTNAQNFKWGVKGGLSTPEIKPADATEIKSGTLSLKVSDANYGIHGGAWARVGISKFYIQPEVILNSSKVTYRVKDTKLGTILDSLQKESFLNLDVPVLLGLKVGTFRLNAGPVGHLHLNSTSDLVKVSGYKENFGSMKFGYQAGIGLDFGSLGIDIRYEGNFDKFGDHINIGGTAYNFSKTPSRLLVSFALGF